MEKQNYLKEISKGMVVLLGIKSGDGEEDLKFLADKCCSLRIFEDKEGKMNLSVKDMDGEMLVIPQFTLYGDAWKGNRPGFTDAARPEEAIPIYESFIKRVKAILGDHRIKTGIFGAMMRVKIINEGPVTIIIDSKKN